MAGVTLGWMRYMLGLDTGAFDRGASSAERRLGSMSGKFDRAASRFGALGKSLGGFSSGIAGALTIGAFARLIQGGLEYAGSLGEVAAQLGVTTKELQNFRFAAGQNGATVEEADKALGKFSLSISKARSGSAEAAKAFGAVGVKLADLETNSKSEILGKIADKMKATGGASANAAAGVAIFGKGFQKIIPTLDLGSKGISDLAAANEALGGVLSDEQIQNADRTADKLRQVKEVLSAQIAGVVADNADSIFKLADAFAYLASKVADYVNAISRIGSEGYPVENFFTGKMVWVGGPGPAMGGQSVSVKLPPAQNAPRPPVSQFLASKGGGHKAAADHSAQDALRDSFQFDQELRRAQTDVLQALQDLAKDYVERTSIGIEILDAEKAGFDAEQRYQVALFALTKGKQGMSAEQARQLAAEYAKTDALKRQALLEEEEAQRRADVAMLIQTDFDTQKDKLDSELQLARTVKEQRNIQLQLLDLSYRQERARLEAVLADEKASEAAKEDARRRLLALGHTYANDRQGVINQTRSPLDQWKSDLPQSLDEVNQKLEEIAVTGLTQLEDDLASATVKALGLKGALGDVASQLIKLGLQILASYATGGNPLGNLFGGPRALGGPVRAGSAYLVGEEGPEIFMPSGSGRIISNDNSRRMMGRGAGGGWYGDMHVHGVRDVGGFNRSEGQITRQLNRRLSRA